MIKKQKKLIITCAIAFAVLTVLYFAVVVPIVNAVTEEEPPQLLEGEVLGSNNRILMMEHVENADIYRLEVHNDAGGFTFYRAKDENLYLEGMEGTPYSLSALSSVVVASGYTLAMERVTTDCEDMSEYGLSDADTPAWYEITTMAGLKHKIYIGKMLVTGAGYYCRYEGRNAVYILDSTVSCLLGSAYDLITPMLTQPVSTSDYYGLDNFYVIKDGGIFVWIDYLTAEEIETTAALGDYQFLVPEGYVPNLTAYGNIITVMANFCGDSVVLAGNDVDAIDADILKEKYGIDVTNPDYALHYTCNDVDSYVVFSRYDEEGNMYAYSGLFNLVAKLNISGCAFLDWDLLTYLDKPIFQKNINEIAHIEVIGGDVEAIFTLEGEGTDLKVTPKGGTSPYDADDLRNFREFYKTMLTLKLEDYAEVESAEGLACMAKMVTVTDAGITTEYAFYPYSTRHCLFTINGEGEFYCLRDMVDKLLSDGAKILSGEPVDSDAKD